MVAKGPKLVIDNEAKAELRSAYNYIRNDSLQNAGNVKSSILRSLNALVHNPQQHPPDKYKTHNDGSFRAYELYKLRIAYHVSDQQITVIRIRHTKMNPLLY